MFAVRRLRDAVVPHRQQLHQRGTQVGIIFHHEQLLAVAPVRSGHGIDGGIAGHHDENVTTSVLMGIAAQILFPVLNLPALITGSAATTAAATSAAGATVSTVTTTAVASAASFAGSRALRATFRPQQVAEAEAMALDLLAGAGWDGREVAEQLRALPPLLPDGPGWTEELHQSAARVASLMQGPPQFDLVKTPPQIVPRPLLELPPPLISVPF